MPSNMKLVLLLVSICTVRGTNSKRGAEVSLMQKTSPRGNTLICTDTGISFRQFLQRTNVYVDKTLLIKTVVEDLKNYSIIITGPRRWGKSLNIQLLRFFWEAELDENATLVPIQQTEAYKFFFYGKLKGVNGEPDGFDRPPLVSKHNRLLFMHMGQYPIIALNFSTIDTTDLNNFTVSVKAYICEKVYEYFDVMHNLCVNKINVHGERVYENISYFNTKFVNMQKRCKEDEEDPFRVEQCLYYVTEILAFTYKSKVIVLIDGYESLLYDMYARPLSSPTSHGELLWIEDFHWKFVHSIVHNNSRVERTIFTGVLPMLFDAGAQLNHVNDMIYYSNTHPQLHAHYGFSQAEVDLIFHRANVSENQSREACATYNGYPIGKTYDVTVYAPWSIVNFVNSRRVEYYWALADSLFSLPVLRNRKHWHILEQLRHYQCVPNDAIEPQTQIAVRRMNTLRFEERKLNEFEWSSHILEELTRRLFYWYFNIAGYFVMIDSNPHCSVLPNYEIHAVLNSILYGVPMYYKYEPDAAGTLIRLLPPKNNEVEPLIRYFKQMLLSNNSEWKISENFTRARFFDILHTARKTYKCNVTMDLPLLTPQNVSVRPSMVITNEYLSAIMIETKYNRNDSEIRDTILHHLWPYSRAYFLKYPDTRSLKMIIVNVGPNRTIQYTNFSATSIREIPSFEQSVLIKKFRNRII